MAGILYLVATPIGNLGDLSSRGRETLENADFIAAEDTRVTRKLLNFCGIHKPMVSYFEHNRIESGETILKRLLAGETCALVSDAGTPVISDPGAELIRDCVQAGIQVIAIPGPCAAISGLILSGLPAGRFTFEGFLPVRKKERQLYLEQLRQEPRTMIFYEAPHRLVETLEALLKILGNRPAAACRELTKLHEQVQRSTLEELLDWYRENTPRGEFVLVVGGCPAQDKEVTLQDALQLARQYTVQGLSCRDAARRASEETGRSRKEVYSQLLQEERS